MFVNFDGTSITRAAEAGKNLTLAGDEGTAAAMLPESQVGGVCVENVRAPKGSLDNGSLRNVRVCCVISGLSENMGVVSKFVEMGLIGDERTVVFST